MIAAITGWGLLVLGIGTAIGAIWLAVLGGSPFYLVIAAGLLVTGYLLIRHHYLLARWLYAGFLLVVLVWALWEVGFDWWALVPRGVLLTLIGLWLLLPWFGRTYENAGSVRPSHRWRGGLGVLAASRSRELCRTGRRRLPLPSPWRVTTGRLMAGTASVGAIPPSWTSTPTRSGA